MGRSYSNGAPVLFALTVSLRIPLSPHTRHCVFKLLRRCWSANSVFHALGIGP
jgi:hypothetical protein